MTKDRRKGSFLVFLILIIIAGIIGGVIFYSSRVDKKKQIDDLINTEMLLRVEYGVVERDHVLEERNRLLKRTIQDNECYLYINGDNILFTYYMDWYYNIDPLQGYVLENKIQLKEKQVKNIMDQIKEKAVKDLGGKVEADYVSIYVKDDKDNEYKFIEKNDLQMILQDEDIFIEIYKKTVV